MSKAYTGPFTGKQMNAQPVEKLIKHVTDMVDVHSIFHTIQGEGPFCGRSAVFVRLAGCQLQCPLCDTEYTDKRMVMKAVEVVRAVNKMPLQDGGLVVITGGEPFRQPHGLAALCMALIDNGNYVQIETNGCLPIPMVMRSFIRTYYSSDRPSGLYIVCSPKTGKVQETINHYACAFKYVLSKDAINWDDGLPFTALGHVAYPQLARPPVDRQGVPTRPVYVQPADHQNEVINEANTRLAVESAMRFGYILQLQVHKYINME